MSIVIIKTGDHKKWNGISNEQFPGQGILAQAYVSGNKYILGCSDEELESIKTKLGLKFDIFFNPSDSSHPLLDIQYLPRIEDGTTMFDTSSPIEHLKSVIAKGQPFVAKNKEQMESNPVIYTHYVFSEEEASEKAAGTFDKMKKAFEIYAKLKPETSMMLIGIILQKRVSSPKMIEAEMKLIFDKYLDEFLQYSENAPEELRVRELVISGINQNIIVEDIMTKQFMFGDFSTGRNIEEVVSYFSTQNDLLGKLETIIGGIKNDGKGNAHKVKASSGEDSEQQE